MRANADMTTEVDNTAEISQPYGLQGTRLDANSRNNHSGYRDNRRSLRRWTQQDPAGYVDGLNVYRAYVSNPISLVDPSGLRGEEGRGDVASGWKKDPRIPRTPRDIEADPVQKEAAQPLPLTVLGKLESARAKWSKCFLYKAAGIDALFDKLFEGARNSSETIDPSPTAQARFQNRMFLLNNGPLAETTAIHESVHAYNYKKGYHQRGDGGLLADEGMAYAVENMLGTLSILCNSVCTSCQQAQQLWNGIVRMMGQIEGAQSGTSTKPDTVNRNHIWDVNSKLGFRFSSSAILPLFQAELAKQKMNCTLTNPAPRPVSPNGQPDAGQPDPFA